MFDEVYRVFEIAFLALGYEGDAAFLLTVASLTFVRFAAFSLTIPAFGIGFRNYSGKLAVALALTFVTVPISLSGQSAATEGVGGGVYFALLVKEIAVGFCFGILMGLFFEAIRGAGYLIERYLGLERSELTEFSDRSMIGSFKLLLASLLFFVSGAYAPVFGALAESVTAIPVTSFQTYALNETWLPAVVETGGAFFVISIGLALPFIFVLMTTDIVFAVVQRSTPGLQFLALRAPVRPLLAIVVLAIFLQVLILRFETVFTESFRALERSIKLFG